MTKSTRKKVPGKIDDSRKLIPVKFYDFQFADTKGCFEYFKAIWMQKNFKSLLKRNIARVQFIAQLKLLCKNTK